MPIRLVIGLLFFLVIIVASMRSYTVVSKPMSAAAHCGIDEQSLAKNINPDSILIDVWAQSWGKGCWRGYAIQKAAERLTEHDISVSVRTIEAGAGGYRNVFNEAAENGTAPDIAWAPDSGILKRWSDAGYIVPLDECIQRHDEFDHVYDELWSAYSLHNQIWGIPVEAAIYGLYFNKEKLRSLGWSEQEIDTFPERIRYGTFTLDDLATTARQAVQTGVVQSGYGLWPYFHEGNMIQFFYRAHGGAFYGYTGEVDERDGSNATQPYIDLESLTATYRFAQTLLEEEIMHPAFAEQTSNSWFNRVTGNDASAYGRTLFWVNQSARWGQDYVHSYESLEELDNNIGFALIPGISAQVRPVAHLSTMGFYVISARKASGRDGQAISCQLLAQSVLPEIHTLNVAKSSNFGVIKSMESHPETVSSKFMSQITYMWDYSQPKTMSNIKYNAYRSIMQESFVSVVQGDMTPEVAALTATQNLRRELGAILVPQSSR